MGANAGLEVLREGAEQRPRPPDRAATGRSARASPALE